MIRQLNHIESPELIHDLDKIIPPLLEKHSLGREIWWRHHPASLMINGQLLPAEAVVYGTRGFALHAREAGAGIQAGIQHG